MYTALEESANSTGALTAYPEVTITDIMKSWIDQAGHPLLHVSVDYNNGNVALTQVQKLLILPTLFCFLIMSYLFKINVLLQERFYTNPLNNSNEKYQIPITYTTGMSPNFTITKPAFIMTDNTYSFNISNLEHNWVIFNIQESGTTISCLFT